MLTNQATIEAVRLSLGRLTHASFERVLARAVVREFAAGDRLFDTARTCQGLPLLVAGSMRVVRYSAKGREVQLYRVSAGESCILSITQLLGGPQYEAVGIAETTLRVVVLDTSLFHELIATDSNFRQHIFGIISARIAELMSLVEAIAFDHLDERLARILLAEGPQLATTHQRLAERTGSVREIVGRVLRNFENRGLIEIGRERITVCQAEGLRAVIGGGTL